jgi:hypothetical protein
LAESPGAGVGGGAGGVLCWAISTLAAGNRDSRANRRRLEIGICMAMDIDAPTPWQVTLTA